MGSISHQGRIPFQVTLPDGNIEYFNIQDIEGAEGGLRIDVFDHDENSEYDFSESDCTVCELPEHAQNHIIEDIEYEENA